MASLFGILGGKKADTTTNVQAPTPQSSRSRRLTDSQPRTSGTNFTAARPEETEFQKKLKEIFNKLAQELQVPEYITDAVEANDLEQIAKFAKSREFTDTLPKILIKNNDQAVENKTDDDKFKFVLEQMFNKNIDFGKLIQIMNNTSKNQLSIEAFKALLFITMAANPDIIICSASNFICSNGYKISWKKSPQEEVEIVQVIYSENVNKAIKTVDKRAKPLQANNLIKQFLKNQEAKKNAFLKSGDKLESETITIGIQKIQNIINLFNKLDTTDQQVLASIVLLNRFNYRGFLDKIMEKNPNIHLDRYDLQTQENNIEQLKLLIKYFINKSISLNSLLTTLSIQTKEKPNANISKRQFKVLLKLYLAANDWTIVYDDKKIYVLDAKLDYKWTRYHGDISSLQALEIIKELANKA